MGVISSAFPSFNFQELDFHLSIGNQRNFRVLVFGNSQMFENPHYNLYENVLLGKLKVLPNLAQTIIAKTSDQSKHKASRLLSLRTLNPK